MRAARPHLTIPDAVAAGARPRPRLRDPQIAGCGGARWERPESRPEILGFPSGPSNWTPGATIAPTCTLRRCPPLPGHCGRGRISFRSTAAAHPAKAGPGTKSTTAYRCGGPHDRPHRLPLPQLALSRQLHHLHHWLRNCLGDRLDDHQEDSQQDDLARGPHDVHRMGFRVGVGDDRPSRLSASSARELKAAAQRHPGAPSFPPRETALQPSASALQVK